MKRLLTTALILLAASSVLGGLFAASGTASIDITIAGTAATGGSVTEWSSDKPQWFPVKEAVGAIDPVGGTEDGDSGGLFTIKVPATPAGTYRITLFMLDPQENVEAYGFFNMGIKVVAAGVASDALTESQTIFGDALSVIDHDGDGNLEVDDRQILNAQKGFISFIISSGDGTLVDTSNRTSDHGSYAGADARAFDIGIQNGSFFTTETASSDNLSPEFRAEVSQR